MSYISEVTSNDAESISNLDKRIYDSAQDLSPEFYKNSKKRTHY